MYISCDDILEINDMIYEITGIGENYDVYVMNRSDKNQQQIYTAPDFIQMLQSSDFKYLRNIHEDNIAKNRLCSSYA